MKYTVVWVKSAEEEATRLWMECGNREEISQAVDAVDSLLQRQPYEGESRGNVSDRVLWIEPVAVAFEVFEGDCIVRVKRIWLTR